MNCPVCNGGTKVIHSKFDEDSVQRRRECLDCGHRYNTLEVDLEQYNKMKYATVYAVRSQIDEAMAKIKYDLYSALNID